MKTICHIGALLAVGLIGSLPVRGMDIASFELPSGTQVSVDVSALSGLQLQYYRISNNTDRPVTNLWIRDASKEWGSPKAILQSALGSAEEMSDSEKAQRLFQYVTHHLGQDAYRSRWDCYDVWKAFNCYGAGHCEFHARTLSALLEMAGIFSLQINLRTPDIEGGLAHTMVEAWYEGGWHLFDPHGRVSYPASDRSSVAGWTEILANPDLLLKSGGPRGWPFEEVDTGLWFLPDTRTWYDHKKSRVEPEEGSSSPPLTLFPGDSFRVDRDGKGVYVDNLTDFPAPLFPQAKATLERVYPQPNREWEGLLSRAGFEMQGDGTLYLGPQKNGKVALEIASPYPIVSATVELKMSGQGEEQRLLLRGGRSPLQDKRVEELSVWDTIGSGQEAAIPLAESISHWNNPFVTYAYRLYLEGHTGLDSFIQVESMRIRTVCQVAVASLPDLEAGPWNLISAGPGVEGTGLRMGIAGERLLRPD